MKMIAARPATAYSYPVLVMGIFAVSLAAIFIRLAQEEAVPSLVIAAGRLSIAALVLTPLTLRNAAYRAQLSRLKRQDVLLALVAGIFLAAHFAAWVTSLEYTTVLISVVVVTTTPIWVALLEIFFLRSPLQRHVIIGMAVALGGSIIIGAASSGSADSGDQQLLGAALSAVGAVTVAVYLIIGRRLRPSLSLLPYIWLVYGCGALILAGVVVLTGTSVTGHPVEGYLWVAAVGLIPQLIGHSSLNYALAYLPATYVSIATQAEPIGSAIIAVIVFREIPGVWQVAGSLVILAGVMLATLGQSSAQKQQEPVQT